MGSKTAITAAAAVAVTLTLLVWQPWEGRPLSIENTSVARHDAAVIDEPDVSGALSSTEEAPVTRQEARGSSATTTRTAPDAIDGSLEVRATFASDGMLAAGVRGHLENDDGEAELPFALNESGALTIDSLAPGRWNLRLHGYGRWRTDIVAGETSELVIAITQGMFVHGRVLDYDERSGTLRDSRRRAVAAGGPIHRARRPREAGSLRGRVVDWSGTPTAGANLVSWHAGNYSSSEVSPEGMKFGQPPELRIVSDAQGKFACDTLVPGTHSIRVHTGEHPEERVTVTIEPRLIENIEIVLTGGGALLGRVLDPEGTPVAESPVSVLGNGDHTYRWTEADREGVFRFDGLPEGPALVAARSHANSNASESVSIVPGKTTEHDFVVGDDAFLEGVLVDESGSPLVGYGVHIITPPSDGLWHRSSRTDGSGRFRLEGVPEGDKALEVRTPSPFAAPPLIIEPWPEDESDVRLVVPASALPTASIEGTVMDPAGAGVEVVTMWVSSVDYNWGKQFFTDRDTGKFQFGPLAPGDYTLGLSAPGHIDTSFEVSDIESGETRDLGIVTIPAGGVLRVDLLSRNEDDHGLHMWVVSAETGEHHQIGLGNTGTASSDVLPEGDYELRVAGWATRYRSAPATITAGQVTRLELDLEPGTHRRLHLTPPPQEQDGRTIEIYDASGARFSGWINTWSDQVNIDGLGLGEWRVVVRMDDGRTGETTLLVEDLEPTEPIPLSID